MAKELLNGQRKCAKCEIRIRRVSNMMHEDVTNIAAHLGISVNDFLKTKVLDIISTYPKEYLQPFNKD